MNKYYNEAYYNDLSYIRIVRNESYSTGYSYDYVIGYYVMLKGEIRDVFYYVYPVKYNDKRFPQLIGEELEEFEARLMLFELSR
jgi:hypothetical protein